MRRRSSSSSARESSRRCERPVRSTCPLRRRTFSAASGSSSRPRHSGSSATRALLTIVGPGGTGKTRFSIELARFLADEADGGTVFVPLAPVRDAALVVPLIAAHLGASGRHGARDRDPPRRQAGARRSRQPRAAAARRGPADSPSCSQPRPPSGSSRPAASRCGSPARSSSTCRRWTRPTPSRCSSSARRQSAPISATRRPCTS